MLDRNANAVKAERPMIGTSMTSGSTSFAAREMYGSWLSSDCSCILHDPIGHVAIFLQCLPYYR